MVLHHLLAVYFCTFISFPKLRKKEIFKQLCDSRFADVDFLILFADFYKPGHGVFFQCWLTKNDKYSFSRFDDIPQYPSCSTFVVNGDNFEYSTLHLGQNQHCRFRAYFVSSQTGIHKFFSIVNNAAELYIDLSPTGSKEILAIQSRTNNNWDERLKFFILISWVLCNVVKVLINLSSVIPLSLYCFAVNFL